MGRMLAKRDVGSIAARRAGRPAVRAVSALAVVAAIMATAGWAGPGSVRTPSAAVQRPDLSKQPASLDWPAYLFSAMHPSATSGPTAITPANAGQLKVAWTFKEQPPTGQGQPGGGFSASPTVTDGMIFIGSQTGDFYALDESTGHLAWKQTLDYEIVGNNGKCKNVRGIVGTATMAPDPVTGNPTVYVPGARYLYALDAATGTQQWKSVVGPAGSGSVIGAYFNYASPTVANGNVYMGVSSSCDAPFVRGGIQSFNQHSGSLQHSFWTDPSGHVGASVWSSESANQSTVWATTGDPKFTGTSLYYAYSFLQLKADTLALIGKWQLKLPQAADLDFGSSPTLFSGVVKGVSTALVGACNKNGRYYALRANDVAAGPVWSLQVGAAAHTGHGMCLASAAWNQTASELYIAANGTTIGGKSVDGSVREVLPGSGKIQWAIGLSCGVLGSPALDAATGVLAVATWSPCSSTGKPQVYLLNAATGAILATIPVTFGGFAQPVFAGQYLLVADESGQVIAYSPNVTGPALCNGWCAAPRPTQVPAIPVP